MDQDLNETRVPFDMRLHLPPMVQASFVADQYHAMKRLATEGYITIKPGAKLRLGPSGLWEAHGQPPLVETASREQSPVEPYISAETVGCSTLFERWNWGDIGEEDAARVLRLMDGMKLILATRHDNAHPAWTKLEEELDEKSAPYDWTEENLKRAIIEANDKECEDWSAFSASHAYCTGSSPNHRHLAPVYALMKALLHFCGCHLEECYWLETFSAMEEGNENAESARLYDLKLVAQTRDPSNAITILRYVEFVQIARDLDHNRQSFFANMEELYDLLAAMIKERRLGDRMMRLLSL